MRPMNNLNSSLKTLIALLSLIGIVVVSCGLLEPDSAPWPPSFEQVADIIDVKMGGGKFHDADAEDETEEVEEKPVPKKKKKSWKNSLSILKFTVRPPWGKMAMKHGLKP